MCQRHSSFAFGQVQNVLISGEFLRPEFESASLFSRFRASLEWSDLLLPELFLPRFEAVPEHPGKLAKVPDLTALLAI